MKLTMSEEIRICHIQSPTEALLYRASFVGAYQTVFSQPPYSERFYPDEAQSVLQRMLETPNQITLLAVSGRSTVVGFGMGVPLVSRPDVSRHMHGLLPVDHTFYLAELGVLPAYRGNGLGRELVRKRLEMVNTDRFSHAVLRTSVSRDAAQNLYLELGFEDIGVYMEVRSRRIDGSVRSDRRLFLSKVLTRG